MKALHVLGGQIDPVAAEVLGDVLEVFDDLEGRADRVRETDPLGGRGAGDGEHETADGVGGQLAVGEQVVVGLVAGDELVLAVGGDQAEEGLGGERAAADRGLEAAQQGVARGPVEDPVQVGLEGVQEEHPVLGLLGRHAEQPGVGSAGGQVAVADVVDEPGESVDRDEVGAPVLGQEERSHGEVLPRGLVERAALRIAGARRTGCRHRSLPGAGTARAGRSWGSSVAIAVTTPVLHRRPNTDYFGHAARPSAQRPSDRVSRIIAPLAAIRHPYSLRCTTRHGSSGCPAHHNNTPIGPKIPKGARS